MHEISLVADLLDECVRRGGGRPVATVRVRHASTIPPEVLEQAFDLLATDGPLAGAHLEAELFELLHTCAACGTTSAVEHDHTFGHLVVCPACGDVADSGHPVELELVDVVLATAGHPAGDDSPDVC